MTEMAPASRPAQVQTVLTVWSPEVVKSAAVLAVAEPVFDAGAPPEPGFQPDDVRAVVGGDEGGR